MPRTNFVLDVNLLPGVAALTNWRSISTSTLILMMVHAVLVARDARIRELRTMMFMQQ